MLRLMCDGSQKHYSLKNIREVRDRSQNAFTTLFVWSTLGYNKSATPNSKFCCMTWILQILWLLRQSVPHCAAKLNTSFSFLTQPTSTSTYQYSIVCYLNLAQSSTLLVITEQTAGPEEVQILWTNHTHWPMHHFWCPPPKMLYCVLMWWKTMIKWDTHQTNLESTTCFHSSVPNRSPCIFWNSWWPENRARMHLTSDH